MGLRVDGGGAVWSSYLRLLVSAPEEYCASSDILGVRERERERNPREKERLSEIRTREGFI